MSNVQSLAGRDRPEAAERAAAPARHTLRFNNRRIAIVAALAAGDVAAAAGSILVLAMVAWLSGQSVAHLDAARLCVPVGFLIVIHMLLGLYETFRYSPVELFRLRALAAMVFAGLVAETLGAGFSWSVQVTGWLVLVPMVVIAGLMAGGLARRVLMRVDMWQLRIVLVGDQVLARDLSGVLEATPAHGIRILARVPPGDPRLVHPGTLAQERADLAVLLSCGNPQEDARIAADLDFPAVIITREVGDMQTLWLKTRTLGGAIGIELRRSSTAGSLLVKRALDVLVSVTLLVLTLPVMLGTAALVWYTDRRWPFYGQTRVGLDGRGIRVWKIRSMFVDAEARLAAHLASDADARAEWARSFKLRDDPRILPGIGSFIRRTSLDELPQLWNVVRGEMSLVGPRPFPAYHLAGFDESFQALRASVTPGLTGLWQITARSDSDLLVQKSADTFYLRNWSIWFDLYILIHTLPAVVFGKGAR